MRVSSSLLATTILLVIATSCSGGSAPTAPDAAPKLSTRAAEHSSARTCWGIWDVRINASDGSVEIVPIRGASFEANVLNFLQPPKSPVNLLTVEIDPTQSNLAAGKVVCDVTLKHPFPGTKFCGFDVLGIVMDDWEAHPWVSDFEIISSLPPYTLLQNPDGWTRWWNQKEFTTYGTLFGYIEGNFANHGFDSTHTLNAYKCFSDDLEPDEVFDPGPFDRCFFSSSEPGVNTRRYDLQFYGAGGVFFNFKYAVSASWVAPYDSASPPYAAQDFPNGANMPEAYYIRVIDNGSTAYYGSPTIYGGDLDLLVEVRDWQLDGELSAVSEEIEGVTIESPTLFPAPIDLDVSGALPVPGNPTAVRVPVVVEDVTPTGVDNQLLIITVRSGHPTTYEPQIPGITGYDYPEGSLAAYAILEARIIGEGGVSGWPMYRRDFTRSGRTGVVGPVTNTVKFCFTTPEGSGAPVYGGIAVDSRGRAVFRTDLVGRVYCIEPDGEVAWSFDTGSGCCHSSPSIGPDDSVYVGSPDSDLWHIDSEGSLIWHRTYSHGIPSGGIAVQADGSVLFTTWPGRLVKVDSMGVEKWMFKAPVICGGPSVGDDGTIYIASHEGRVYSLDQAGGEVWTTEIDESDFVVTPVLGPHGIYLGNDAGDLVCLRYDGSIKWTVPIGSNIRHCAALDDDGNVYVGSWDNDLYCLDQVTGDVQWSYPTDARIWCSGPLVDGGGHVYVTNYGGHIYCLTSSGELVWDYEMGCETHCLSGAISDDGTLLIGNGQGELYAFQD